jgi:hypothetical protein
MKTYLWINIVCGVIALLYRLACLSDGTYPRKRGNVDTPFEEVISMALTAFFVIWAWQLLP